MMIMKFIQDLLSGGDSETGQKVNYTDALKPRQPMRGSGLSRPRPTEIAFALIVQPVLIVLDERLAETIDAPKRGT
jgi:ABC-type molybdate transport system ATPase subunit